MDHKKLQRYLLSLLATMLLVPCVVHSTAMDASVVASTIEKDKLLFAQALELSVQQQWSAAESIYRDLLARNKEWPEPKNNLAILLLKTNRLDEAKSMLEDAVVSSPSYRIAQKNRTQLYTFLATQAYDKALGGQQSLILPEMDYIEHIYQPVKVVEKVVDRVVEKVVEKEVVVNKVAAVEPQVIATPQSVDKSSTEIAEHIKQQLLGWSQAWSSGDFDRYIQAYSDNFIPLEKTKNLAEWKNIRKAKLKFGKGVQVTLEDIRVFMNGSADYVLVEFVQNYKSRTYSDKTLKQLYMKNSQSNWLILSERVIKTF